MSELDTIKQAAKLIAANKVKEGYILTVANLTETSFQLLDAINVGGKMVNVVYQFEKK